MGKKSPARLKFIYEGVEYTAYAFDFMLKGNKSDLVLTMDVMIQGAPLK